MTNGTVTLTVTRSAGDDRAVLVFIDTDFAPDASDGGPGLRVLLNDDEAFVGVAYDLGANHEAESKSFTVSLTEVPYHEGERASRLTEPFTYVATHRSVQDGSPAQQLGRERRGKITLVNEDGYVWTDPSDMWSPITDEQPNIKEESS